MGSAHPETIEHETPILIVGAGPIGMLTALELSRLGVDCLLAEKSLETTKWPKMDMTNCRSMEILRLMGLVQDLRLQDGYVNEDSPWDSIFFSSFSPGGEVLTAWKLSSVNIWRDAIAKNNDGTWPAEPAARCSQIILEGMLKKKCLEQSSVNSNFGWTYQSHKETSDGIESLLVDNQSRTHIVRSKYLVGADGGGSRVRKHSGIKMLGGPLPISLFLVHFRSKELHDNLPLGNFWHAFPPFGGFIVNQDEAGTFTVHMQLDSLDQDVTKIDPYELVYKCFGGAGDPYRFKIDEILVTSSWRPNFGLAETYISPGGRLVLAGDAAHRNPPHGGYGLNSGLEDAIAVAWRLSAIIKGYGGQHLLQSYEDEQRPTMIQRLERCSSHVAVHFPRDQWYNESGPAVFMAKNQEGEELRQKIRDNLDAAGSECLDRGTELDSRYNSAVIFKDGSTEPEWKWKQYTPSTFPGARAPHVFLKDGKTSILDTYGPEWTLVVFTDENESTLTKSASLIANEAEKISMPLKCVFLKYEKHVHAIWGCNIVLVRADGHVAWRSQESPNQDTVEEILKVVTGQKVFPGYVPVAHGVPNIPGMAETTGRFSERDLLAVGEVLE